MNILQYLLLNKQKMSNKHIQLTIYIDLTLVQRWLLNIKFSAMQPLENQPLKQKSNNTKEAKEARMLLNTGSPTHSPLDL